MKPKFRIINKGKGVLSIDKADLEDHSIPDRYSDLERVINATYEEIKSMSDQSLLVPGHKYAIQDYKTEYVIVGSNSSGIIKTATITNVISGYGVLNNNYDYDLKNGQTVEITKLPDGYSGN